MLSQVFPNHTWVCLPKCSKANLLTPGCGEGKCTLIAGAKQGVQTAGASKAQIPEGFRKGFLKTG